MDNGGKDDRYYLHLIDNAIDEMLEHLDGFTIEDFKTNYLVMNAFAMAVQNIGENTNKLSNELREKYIEVPWHTIIHTRHIVTHNYEGISIDRLYDLVKRRMPKYSLQIKAIIKNEGYD